jgi:two-component system sensor histidine kinase DegS
VSFTTKEEKMIIEIKDNGIGFDPEVQKERGKLGLFGIEERIIPWHGNVTIQSKLGEGTNVIISFPINEIIN